MNNKIQAQMEQQKHYIKKDIIYKLKNKRSYQSVEKKPVLQHQQMKTPSTDPVNTRWVQSEP